jgi:hypothetical protein
VCVRACVYVCVCVETAEEVRQTLFSIPYVFFPVEVVLLA